MDVRIEKEGYYKMPSEGNQTSFEFAEFFDKNFYLPDKENPVVFLMGKKGTPANLIKGELTLCLEEEGASAGIDFFMGKAVGAGQGQMQVTTWKPEYLQGVSTYSFDWAVEIKFPDGGFVECHDVFPFLAPESGYVSEMSQKLHFTRDGLASVNHFKKKWYFRFGNPPRYGRMTFSTYGNMPNFNVSYYLNPTPGDRNLESDPNRRLRPE